MTVHTRYPRAVLSRVYGNQTPQLILAQIQAAQVENKEAIDGRINSLETNMQRAIDDLNAKAAGGNLGAVLAAEDPQYSKLFASWARGGQGEHEVKAANMTGERSQIKAAMNSGTAGDGGYLAPTEWDRQIQKALRAVSPMRRIATVKATSVGAYSTLWNTTGFGTGWVGETAGRPATTTPTLVPVTFGHGETDTPR
jgi:HK97 family phage major capsid protein